MIIIITIICSSSCGVQVHLLLGEKVKVSQTSQSRPAALHTAHCTNISCCSTAWPHLLPIRCSAIVMLWGGAVRRRCIASSLTLRPVRLCWGQAKVKMPNGIWSNMLQFFSFSTAYALRGKPVELYNCFLPSTIEKVFFSGSALCAKDIGNGEALHKHTAPPALPLSGRSYLQAWWCRLQTLPHKYRWHGAEIDKCIQFILILERWKSPCPQCFPGRGIPLQCIFGFDKRYVHWSWSTYLDISC